MLLLGGLLITIRTDAVLRRLFSEEQPLMRAFHDRL